MFARRIIKTADPSPESPPRGRELAIDWDELVDAFGNTTPDIHQYLNLTTGTVVRIEDNGPNATSRQMLESDRNYLPITPVHPAHQYRWMQEYVETLTEPTLIQKLQEAMQGKGAFRRFKDVLLNYEPERNAWFSFRKARLRSIIEEWLAAHRIAVATPPPPPISASPSLPASPSSQRLTRPEPAVEERPVIIEGRPASTESRSILIEGRPVDELRARLHELADSLNPRDVYALTVMAEFMKTNSRS